MDSISESFTLLRDNYEEIYHSLIDGQYFIVSTDLLSRQHARAEIFLQLDAVNGTATSWVKDTSDNGYIGTINVVNGPLASAISYARQLAERTYEQEQLSGGVARYSEALQDMFYVS